MSEQSFRIFNTRLIPYQEQLPPLIEQVGVNIPGGESTDEFGNSVDSSADGKRIIIGAPGDQTDTGEAKVFEFDGTNWNQIGLFNGSASGDKLGFDVAMSKNGNVTACGIPESGNAGAGQVIIQDYDSGTSWTSRTSIPASSVNPEFGYSVELNGDGSRVIIGYRLSSGGAGHAEVYEWSGSAWAQLGEEIGVGDGSEGSGRGVGLSDDGNVAVVGGRGHIRAYEWSGSAWIETGDIDINGSNSGWTVGLSGDGKRIATSEYESVTVPSVWVFEYDGAAWNQIGQTLVASTGTQFGSSVSLNSNGNLLAVGADQLDLLGAVNGGKIYVYKYYRGSWLEFASIEGSSTDSNLGSSISISDDGTLVASGAPFKTDEGPTYVTNYLIQPQSKVSFK